MTKDMHEMLLYSGVPVGEPFEFRPRKLKLSRETLASDPPGDQPQRDSQYGVTCWEGECGPPPPAHENRGVTDAG